MVTNGGAIFSPLATLNVANGKCTLNKSGAITVQSLLATNVVLGGVTNSVLAFNNGGALTTSNANGFAADVLLPSGTSWTFNGTWNMQAGTNRVASVQTNGSWFTFYVGNGASNSAVTVNPGAVWSLGYNSTLTNMNLYLTLGTSAGGSYNRLLVNNGLVTNVAPMVVANTAGDTGNELVLTNGGRVFIGNGNNNGNPTLTVGNGTNSFGNGLTVAGMNAGGGRSLLNLGNGRLYLGNPGTFGNWARIDQGGVVTNGTFYSFGTSNSLAILNGGQLCAQVYCGRAGISDSATVAGADEAGNKAAILSPGNMYVGGGGTATSLGCGTNNLLLVGQDGLVRATTVYVGGATSDTNAFANGLCVTNGGQLFVSGSGGMTLGGAAGCSSNWVSAGGSPAPGADALVSLGGYALTIGGNASATGNYATVSSGGVVSNGTIVLGGASSRLYFDGGKLIARANGYPISTNAVATDAQIVIRAGGAVFDSGAFTITNTLALQEDPASAGGGLTKLGSGRLVLLGANTYSGSNVVAAGTLTVAGAFSANLSVLGGATLNGTGTLRWQVGQTVSVGGALDISQMSLEIQPTGLLTVGDRVIVDYASGSLSGTAFANVTGLPPKSRVVNDVAGKKIVLRTFATGTMIRVR